tara:strand:+ start:24268 stop:24528 length:261 start_codon:yes stop_codon:yes gene_type:complete
VIYSNSLKYTSEAGDVGFIESGHVTSVDVSSSVITINTNIGKTLFIQLSSSEEAEAEALNVVSNVETCNRVESGDFILSKLNTTTI